MRYWRLLTLLIVILLAFTPSIALAAEPRQGTSVVIGPNETIDDDLYAFGQSVNVQGTIRGDLVAFASNVVVGGTVTGDVIAAGGSVSVPGKVGGSIRAAGANVIVEGAVGGDVVVGSGTLTLGPSASVGRDVWLGTGNATLGGKVGRNIRASTGDLTLNGAVGGNVQAQVGTLRVTDRASLGGDLVYTSAQQASISPDAKIRGRVEHRMPEERQPSPAARVAAALIGWIRALVGLTALGLLFVLPFPAFSQRTVETLRQAPWASLGLGCATLVVVPIVALIVFIVGLIIGGWWLGLMALAIYGIMLALGYVVGGLFVGRWVLDRAGRPGLHRVWALVVGLVILTLIALVPILGGIVGFVALLFGAGALVLAAWQAWRRPAEAGGEVG